MQTLQFLAFVSFLLGFSALAYGADDPFAAGVRPTDPLSPEEEQRAFHLPPGFKIQLVAAEPEIQKPLNLAFDAGGRLWVTDTQEYPYAAPPDRPGRDSLKVLEDTNGDGRADRITTFADELNIPIGVYPYRNGAIVYSIPNIWFFADHDGDGKADERIKLLGPFGYDRDTHGMNNAFRRGFDGLVYACHGFNNITNVTAADGSSVSMQSGNTYRFTTDGRHIEQYTWGQVNPFGMTFDPRGQIYTADCHTKPIMLLIRGGYYDSFGKPHDGLGYVPGVMDHDHGSTAIAGSVYYTGELFPPEYRGNVYSGNVMTSRVNRDSLVYHGSSVRAKEEPDFLSTDDPWFRPVDLQIGPDGALYIADFYNKIIGHYEVRIDHPERDRHRGRIWRVTYEGPGAKPSPSPNFANAKLAELIASLSHPVLPTRMRATDELVDRIGAEAEPALRTTLSPASVPAAYIQAMWALYRLQALAPGDLVAAGAHPDSTVRTHVMRVLSETPDWNEDLANVLRGGLKDDDPFVRRAAAETLIARPDGRFIDDLFLLQARTASDDVHALHTIKIALRNVFRDAEGLTRYLSSVKAAQKTLSAEQRELIAEVCLGLANEDSARFLLAELERPDLEGAIARAYLNQIAKHLPSAEVETIARVAQERAADELDLQLELLSAVRNGLAQRGLGEVPAVTTWAGKLSGRLLASADPEAISWQCLEISGKPDRGWNTEPRLTAEGGRGAFLSSLTLGEGWKGTLRSRDFEIPAELKFHLCGHLGPPDKPAEPHNLVRLKSADTGEVLAEALAPRNDVAQAVHWNLEKHAGQRGYLEIIDGLDTPGYAWIAVGQFEPPVARFPTEGLQTAEKRLVSGADLVAALSLTDSSDALAALARESSAPRGVRFSATRGLASLRRDPLLLALATLVNEPSAEDSLVDRIISCIGESQDDPANLASEIMRGGSAAVQQSLAQGLVQSQPGAELLLKLMDEGKASTQLLANKSLAQQMQAALNDVGKSRVAEIVGALPSRNEALSTLMATRGEAFRAQPGSQERGAAVFKQRCAACHQVGGIGAVIGPQLDGIGSRGVERIIEDVLDPNRNIDQAFRMHTYVLDDGRILNGLPRRVEGESQVIADQEGKELSFPTAAIEANEPAALSLMPETLGAQIPDAEFNDLLAFLAAQRGKPAEPH